MRWIHKYKQEIKQHPSITPLLLRLTEKGWKVRFVKWVNKNVDGYCDARKREIVVVVSKNREVYYPRTMKRVAWILAHEYRHAWQEEHNKYLAYIYGHDIRDKEISENDANQFADRYVKNFWLS